MAEFKDVARQWKRMCEGYWTLNSCSGCPIAEYEEAYEACASAEINVDKMQELILKWAKDNPEPVYPTWAEYLNSIGVTISDQPFHAQNIPVCVYQAGLKMFEPIDREYAEKLGIKPKED